MQRTASAPAARVTHAAGIWTMSVPPASSSTSGRSRKRANAWQFVADEAKGRVRRDLAGDATHMAASAAERERHAAIVARIEQMGLAEVASPMTSSTKPGERRISYASFPSFARLNPDSCYLILGRAPNEEGQNRQ
jgi:hypothetical protein